jgi:hypothetical protein
MYVNQFLSRSERRTLSSSGTKAVSATPPPHNEMTTKVRDFVASLAIYMHIDLPIDVLVYLFTEDLHHVLHEYT